MSTYRAVLARLRKGIPPEQIAEELDRRTEAIKAMLESMEREGHVRRIDCEAGACSACPMADACAVPTETPEQYVVTEAGETYLAERSEQH